VEQLEQRDEGRAAGARARPRLRAPLSVGRAGFTLDAATRAGAMDERGRETLLK
jgi:hypothetical protein